MAKDSQKSSYGAKDIQALELPIYARKYFWETNANEINPQENSEYVIARILEYGDIDAVRWMLETFDSVIIKKVLSNKMGFSRKSANFWRIFFNLNKDEISCLIKPYKKNQKTHWPY